METGLTSVNSDLIALVESQLLETELHVKDNEDITMADDLLDLELDTMSLRQSTRPNTVFRVPYEKMHDSQTSNSRLSSELCCKDLIRSNNNSALLDTTRSPNYDDMPPLEMVLDEEPTSAMLLEILRTQSSWVTKDTEMLIQQYREDDNCTTCRLCQQHFTTPRRLRVHVPQHYITTFCPCGEYSYHRDYILRQQRTMECHAGHRYDVDKLSFPTFLGLIKPFISDPACYERLSQEFPAPRAITQGPCLKPSMPRPSPLPAHTVPRPNTVPQVVLQRIEVPQRRRPPSPVSPRPSRKRRWQSLSPNRHSSGARNLREVEQRMHELEREIQRLAPRISAAASELKALRDSVAQLKRDTKD